MVGGGGSVARPVLVGWACCRPATLQYATRSRTTTARTAFALLSLILRIGLGQVLARHEVHDGGLAEWQRERAQRHAAVQEAPLVDEAQDLSA